MVEDHYDPQEFYTAIAGLEAEPERGGRCTVCYRLRMRRAAQYAAQNGFDWFTSTLSISPHKDPARINAIGQELEAEFGVRHLPSDFKKQNGYLRSLQLSEEYGLYRQDYCGCEFSAARLQTAAPACRHCRVGSRTGARGAVHRLLPAADAPGCPIRCPARL